MAENDGSNTNLKENVSAIVKTEEGIDSIKRENNFFN